MHEKIVSIEQPDLQVVILAASTTPLSEKEINDQLVENGYETGHPLTVNIFALLNRGELLAFGKDKFIASGENPHQLLLPGFETTIAA